MRLFSTFTAKITHTKSRRPEKLFAVDFCQQFSRTIDTLQRLLNAAARHAYGAINRCIEPERATVRMYIAVEGEAHDLSVAIDHRATGISADNVIAGDEIVILGQINFVFRCEP